MDWDGLLADIDRAYAQSDEDRSLVERSLDLTSQELLARHEELRLALRSVQVGTWTWSKDEDLTIGEGYPNPLFADGAPRFHGRAADLWALVHPEDQPRVSAELEVALSQGKELRLEVRLGEGLGPDRWVMLRGQSSLERGQISGVVLDVTRQHRERQEALARARRTDRLWGALQTLTREVAQIGGDLDDLARRVAATVGWVTEGALASVWLREEGTESLTCAARYGLGRMEALPPPLVRADHPEFFEALEEWRVLTVIDTEEELRITSIRPQYLDPDEVRAMLVAPVRTADRLAGAVVLEQQRRPRDWTPEEQSFAAAVADFLAVRLETERRRRAERELEGQRAFLRQVIDLNPHLIFAKDREGRFSLVNRAVAEVYGTTVEALLGRSDADFSATPQEAEAFQRIDRAVLDAGVEQRIPEEQITDHLGRTHWLETVKRPIVGPDGRERLVLGVATDITERKRGEDERLRLTDELRQAQKMEAIGALASGVAHDFNNLLMPILISAEDGVSDLPPEDPKRELFVEILSAGRQAKDLTAQLLAFGRKQRPELRSLDLDQEVRNLLRVLSRLLPENLRLEVNLSSPGISVHADPTQIQQVLLNLVINARDAMPEGGVVGLSTRVVEHDGASRVVLSVRDTGHGISKEDLPRIFDPFFTTKPQGKGTGLGLSTVYAIVQQHGASIDVVSEVGRGTTFRVSFPATQRRPIASPRATTPLPSSPRGEVVLVVEDDPQVRRAVERILGRWGFQVLSAKDGNDALRLVEGSVPALHLLVTDVVLPGLAGPELYHRLLSRWPSLRVLYMTGHPPEFHLDHPGLGEGRRLLRKPFTGSELAERVEEALGKPQLSGSGG